VDTLSKVDRRRKVLALLVGKMDMGIQIRIGKNVHICPKFEIGVLMKLLGCLKSGLATGSEARGKRWRNRIGRR
jgi:hypothetical protein